MKDAMEDAWKNVNAWNNPTEVNRSPTVVHFLHKVSMSNHVSELRAEASPPLPRFFHDPLHPAPSPFPSFRET